MLVTLTLFPLLYLTLELPKRIINDAISAPSETVQVLGYELSQVAFLMVLCAMFLVSVFAHGIMKMRINTMKGVLAERLLRRLRYALIARILRFPAPYFERTSQGELVSMVTSEAEPMGGLMGDAVAQPILQAGQMLTILGFLFFQSFTFGIAACALIPLQAWLIPKLQRQINLLNKKRVVQVRALAAEIGEGAAGASTLRTNGGWRYRMAMIAERLGKLYLIRFEIFQKKFFMKFINNFITQLTPFFFYAIGGYLAIKGEITVGALVAALAAYKDLSSPWKELLTYYNQAQDMTLRWDTVMERFAPAGMVDQKLFEGSPGTLPDLRGEVVLDDVSVIDADGNAVLEDINVRFPKGSSVAITAGSDEDRRALTQVLTRELQPASGNVRINGKKLDSMHQAAIATRIGYASSRPVMFLGTFGENVILPLKARPKDEEVLSAIALESSRAGNGTDLVDVDWVGSDADADGDQAALRAWWLQLVQGIGIDGALFRRGMEQRIDPEQSEELAQSLITLRAEIAAAVAEANLSDIVYFFDDGAYNPTMPLGENLLFAAPRQAITADVLEEQAGFMELLASLDLEADLLQLASEMVDSLRQIFGLDGTDHPLFRKLGLDPETYEAAVGLLGKQAESDGFSIKEKAQLLAVTFAISAEKIGTAFPDDIIERVLQIRKAHGPALRASMEGLFSPISADEAVAGLSVLENALFGKIADSAASKGEALRALICDILRANDLDGLVLDLIFDMPLTLGGANLPALLVEPLAISRATIKRPHVLILDNVLASFDAETRNSLHRNLRDLLPDTTIISLEPEFADTDGFSVQYVMQQGRMSSVESERSVEADSTVSADLARKLRALERTDLFSGLARKQLRLLAFGARWYQAKAGEYVFHKDDDPTSGTFLILEGEADLLLPVPEEDDLLVATSGPGKLVGELGVIRGVPRALDMRAKTDLTCLRIGAEEFLDVVGNDARTAYKLLQVVAGYVSN